MHHVLLQFFPPGSNFLDHISTGSVNEKERLIGLISVFFSTQLTVKCGRLDGKSIKQTREIYEKQPCFILEAISAHPHSWVV